jgi:hypothetical protein
MFLDVSLVISLSGLSKTNRSSCRYFALDVWCRDVEGSTGRFNALWCVVENIPFFDQAAGIIFVVHERPNEADN